MLNVEDAVGAFVAPKPLADAVADVIFPREPGGGGLQRLANEWAIQSQADRAARKATRALSGIKVGRREETCVPGVGR